jgi:hypothetical protein
MGGVVLKLISCFLTMLLFGCSKPQGEAIKPDASGCLAVLSSNEASRIIDEAIVNAVSERSDLKLSVSNLKTMVEDNSKLLIFFQKAATESDGKQYYLLVKFGDLNREYWGMWSEINRDLESRKELEKSPCADHSNIFIPQIFE